MSALAIPEDFPECHRTSDTQIPLALRDSTSDQGHGDSDAPPKDALVGSASAVTDARLFSIPNRTPRPSLLDPALYTLAALLDDIEGVRKASNNRLRILTTYEPDEDGVIRGFGLDESHPSVAVLDKLADGLEALEHQVILSLQRAMRKHPLAAWQKQARGVGEKQLARLLASVGDPYLRGDTGQPRTVSQLWAYCGLHTLPVSGQPSPVTQSNAAADGAKTHPAGTSCLATPKIEPSLPGGHIAAKRQKGVKSNWSTDAKTRAYLIATSCIKTKGEYRDLYDNRRQHTAETHPDWPLGHSHNDALRIVSKRILRDLWLAARDYHTANEAA